MLFLPHHPGFYEYLHSLRPPDAQQVANKESGDFHYVVRSGSLLVEAVGLEELDEYLGGGEYDEALEQQE